MRGAGVLAAAAAVMLAGCDDAGVNRVIDSERVVVDGHKLRLHQVDAPETEDYKCDAERAAADLTVERMQGLFYSAREIAFRKAGMACLQFMTCDAFVSIDGIDLGDTLVAEGLAVRSTSQAAKVDAHDWCAAPLRPEEETSGPNPGLAQPNAESALQTIPDEPESGAADAPGDAVDDATAPEDGEEPDPE